MVDFLSSIKMGLNSANRARNEQQEIDGVLNSFNTQLMGFTEGALKLEILEFAEPRGMAPASIDKMLNPDRYSALTLVYQPEPGFRKEVARWHQDQEGYPCSISIAKTKYACADIRSLEKIFALLAASQSFGSHVQDFMDRAESSAKKKMEVDNLDSGKVVTKRLRPEKSADKQSYSDKKK